MSNILYDEEAKDFVARHSYQQQVWFQFGGPWLMPSGANPPPSAVQITKQYNANPPLPFYSWHRAEVVGHGVFRSPTEAKRCVLLNTYHLGTRPVGSVATPRWCERHEVVWTGATAVRVTMRPPNKLFLEKPDELAGFVAKKDNAFPHKCPRCSSPAYIGFTSFECSWGPNCLGLS